MTSRKRVLVLVVVVLAASGAAVWGASTLWRRLGESMPSHQRARASVAQILFVQGRTLVRNELFELFASDDQGQSWRAVSGAHGTLAVANGNEIWGAHGWPGHHEAPSAAVWQSRDLGNTWTHVALALPSRAVLDAHLPAAFIHEPTDVPLLLMSNAQLVRPTLAADSTTWPRVGAPIEGAHGSRGTVHPNIAGRKHGRSMYVASSDAIHLSNDDGVTWQRQPVGDFAEAKIRCRESECYALLGELGSRASRLMVTELGTNTWRLVRTFDVSAIAPILDLERAPAAFGATALLVTAEDVYVAGIVDAGGDAWGAVLRVEPSGALTRVGQAVREGLWVLEQGPDGALWAGGRGAYRLQGAEWVRVWHAPKS